MENEGLTEEERAAFEKLSNYAAPPDHLETSVIDALKREGLIKTKTITMNTNLKWVASVAASILIFFAGTYWGKQSVNAVEIDPNLGYMLILHEDEDFRPGDPMAMFEEYGAWMQNTSQSGVIITGQELSNKAVMVNSASEVSLGEEAAERISGYFIIEAKSEQEALKVARANPHVKYGGTIELKPFIVR